MAIRSSSDHKRIILVFSLLISLGVALSSSIQLWVVRSTAPASHSRSLLRLSLPGLDIGVDASPAYVDVAGYVTVWVYRHDADDIHMLLQVAGSPPLSSIPRYRPKPYRRPRHIPAKHSTLSTDQPGMQAGRPSSAASAWGKT